MKTPRSLVPIAASLIAAGSLVAGTGAQALQSPAAAPTAVVAAAPAASVTPAAGSTALDITWCPYVVNSNGVRVRTAPSTSATVIGLRYSGDRTMASQNLYYGSGMSWRKAFGGYVASQFLTRTSGRCVI